MIWKSKTRNIIFCNSVYNTFLIKFCIDLNNLFTNFIAYSQHTKPLVKLESAYVNGTWSSKSLQLRSKKL